MRQIGGPYEQKWFWNKFDRSGGTADMQQQDKDGIAIRDHDGGSTGVKQGRQAAGAAWQDEDEGGEEDENEKEEKNKKASG
ncbi:hypothetical protein Dda_2922 [Drechslerella dactyloides]|uniref:Uncharacterized protein n=1 Tax=Drechslerella dactyloides TaxID=74499 RepID=A0AAD6NL08_DREDA|nr:hypothetical protein Dda_2922 [Drechslerella dactyloides]